MPTLKEYILTLRTYNPGISDKTITLYLLKLGKRIEDIQLAFKEVNPVELVNSVNLDNLDTPTPVSSSISGAAHIQGTSTLSTSFVPTLSSTDKVTQATEIEIMPAELPLRSHSQSETRSTQSPVFPITRIQSESQPSQKPIMAAPIVPAAEKIQTARVDQTEIHHQSFDHLIRLQDMIKDLDARDGKEKDLAVEPVDTKNIQSYVGLEQKSPSGSSMQRKKFSYEDLFGPTPTPTSTDTSTSISSSVVDIMSNAISTQKKDPTVSYVGGSIIAGQGSGAFAFNASPANGIHGEEGYGAKHVEHVSEKTEEKSLSTLQMSSGTSTITKQSISGISPKMSTSIPTAPQSIAVIHTTQDMGSQAVDTKINIQTVSHGKGIVKKIVLFIILISIALGGIFGYTRYVHGVYFFVKAPYAADAFIEQLGIHLASIQTAKYEATLDLSTVVPSENDEVFKQQIKSPSLPLGAKITLDINGTYQKDVSSRDNAFAVKGFYADNGIALDINIDSVTNDGVLYVKINAIPSFLLGFSQVRGKWIAVTAEDIETLFGREVPLVKTPVSSKETTVEIFEKAVASGAFSVVGEPQKIITSQQKAHYVYEVAVHLDTLFAVLQEMDTEGGTATLEHMSPEMRDFIDYLSRHTKVLITVDSKGNLVEINIQSNTTTALASTGQTSKTSSVLSLKIKDINQSIKVVPPEKADINSIDAYSLITGQDREGVLFERQVSRVLQTDQAIMNYINLNQQAPLSLKEMIELSKISVKDIFTDPVSEFGYATTVNNGYELTYHIKLPQVPSSHDKLLNNLIIGLDATSQSSTGSVEKYNTGTNTTNKKSALTLRFIEGKNTATRDVLSKEAVATLSKDKDKDGLSDMLEAYLSLDSAKIDTDSDGASDMAELRQGTNPKGTGSWAEAYGSKREDDIFKGDIE